MTIASALSPTPPARLIAAPRIVVDRIVRLGDVIDPADLTGARRRLANLAVLRLPEGRRSVALSRAAVVSLVRRLVPGFAPLARGQGAITFIARDRRAAVARTGCFVSVVAAAAGDPLTRDMAAPAPCTQAKTGAVALDRATGEVRATRDFAAGVYLGPLVLSAPAALRKGAVVRLVSNVGPVRIERVVTALQDARGPRIFVRDGDGQVFAARIDPDGRTAR